MLIIQDRAPRKAPGRGFTTVEILVSLAIMAVLTAVVVPEIMRRVREARASALSQTLFGLSQGIAEYKKAVTRYPSQLTLLTIAPTPNVSTDACGIPNYLSQPNINNWRGPYVSRQILSTGIPMGDGLIENVLTRTASGSAAYLSINVSGLDTAIVKDLEVELDAPPPTPLDRLTGTVRYDAFLGSQTTLRYSIPISGC